MGIIVFQLFIFLIIFIINASLLVQITNGIVKIISLKKHKNSHFTKKNRTLAIIIISFLVTVPIYFISFMNTVFAPRYYFTFVTANSNLNDENINGLKLHQSMKDDLFTSKYGKEYGRIDNALIDCYKLKDGLVIATNKGDDKIISLVVNVSSDESLMTNKGIRIGDSIDKVKQLYGSRYYTRIEEGSKVIGYVDGKEILEFWYVNNKILQIRYEISLIH